MRGVERFFIPKTYLARTLPQVHKHVELHIKINGGHFDHKKASSSLQEVRDRTRVLCETEPEGSDGAIGCGTFTCTLLAPNISLSTQF